MELPFHHALCHVQTNGSDAFVTHCACPAIVEQSQAANARKQTCGNLTRALSMASTWLVITLNYSNKTKPSLPHGEECTALQHTVDLNQSSYWRPTLLGNGKISVKYYVRVSWRIVQTQQSRIWRQSLYVINFFFNNVKCLVKPLHRQTRTPCHTANTKVFVVSILIECPPGWSGMTRKTELIFQNNKELYCLTVEHMGKRPQRSVAEGWKNEPVWARRSIYEDFLCESLINQYITF